MVRTDRDVNGAKNRERRRANAKVKHDEPMMRLFVWLGLLRAVAFAANTNKYSYRIVYKPEPQAIITWSHIYRGDDSDIKIRHGTAWHLWTPGAG